MSAKTNPGPSKNIKNSNNGSPSSSGYQQVGKVNYNDMMHQLNEAVQSQTEGVAPFKSDTRLATDMPTVTSVAPNKLGK